MGFKPGKNFKNPICLQAQPTPQNSRPWNQTTCRGVKQRPDWYGLVKRMPNRKKQKSGIRCCFLQGFCRMYSKIFVKKIENHRLHCLMLIWLGWNQQRICFSEDIKFTESYLTRISWNSKGQWRHDMIRVTYWWSANVFAWSHHLLCQIQDRGKLFYIFSLTDVKPATQSSQKFSSTKCRIFDQKLKWWFHCVLVS